jgi:hypothetical protein
MSGNLTAHSPKLLSRVGGCVAYRLGATGKYSAIADLQTLQFTVTHTPVFSVFTSRILATDFISLTVTRNHTWILLAQPNSPFLSFLLSHIRLPTLSILSPADTKQISWLDGVSKQLNLLNWTLLYNHFARTTQETQPLYCWEGVFTAPLHSNRSYSIVACVFIAEGMCLPGRCLAMNVYSDFTIPAFGLSGLQDWTESSHRGDYSVLRCHAL